MHTVQGVGFGAPHMCRSGMRPLGAHRREVCSVLGEWQQIQHGDWLHKQSRMHG